MGSKKSGGRSSYRSRSADRNNNGGGAGSSLGSYSRSDSEKEVEESYEEYAEETSITERQGKEINERREKLEEVIEDEFNIKDRHMFGSFTRGTMVGPMKPDSDTDVMFVLDENEHGDLLEKENGEKKCLQAIKRKIENHPRYSNTEVKIDRNVVAVKYHDFTVEIAPAFEHQAGGYVIPDTYQEGRSWRRTNPRQYKNMFEATDEAHNGKVQKLSRIAKSWKQKNDIPIRSYHLEVMAYNHVRTTSKDTPIDELTETFFDHLPNDVRRSTHDPAVSEERLDTYMDSKSKQEASKKAKEAREKVDEARKHKENGEPEKAKEKLKEVYGEEFK